MDIVERAAGLSDKSTSEEILNLAADAMDAAADKIEGLREENERLREALRKIASGDVYDENNTVTGAGYFITLARATLGEKE
jgi:hypothetical protein